MHFIISREVLIPLAQKVAGISSTQPALPILKNVLLEARGGEVILTGTDLTCLICLFSSAKVLRDGKTTLPARKFSQLLRELTSSQVEISTGEDHVTVIQANDSSFRINGMDGAEFPPSPSLSDAHLFSVKGKLLRQMAYRATYATSVDERQFVLSGVFLEIEGDLLRLVTTDGKRLAIMEERVEVKESFEQRAIIPLKAVEEISSLIKEEEIVTVHLAKDCLKVEGNCGFFITKFLSGQFPDYKQMLPEKSEMEITFHREELMTLLRQLSLFMTENCQSIRFFFAQGELQLQINNHLGGGKVSMPIQYEGQSFEMAFNPVNFLHALKRSSQETNVLSVVDPYYPAVLTDSLVERRARAVLMPMRISASLPEKERVS